MHAEGETRFTIRRYERGDETLILDLFARSFHERRSVQHWRWKYEDDPYGAERISVAVNEAGALVAHYAGYPVRFQTAEGDVMAHQIGDTMTEPSVRHIGRGASSILGRTALHFYDNFCEGQVAFNFGFNVANIQKFSLRFLRSTRVEDVAFRRRDLKADPMPRLTRLERYARGITLELVRTTSGEWNDLYARVSNDYGFLVRRDAQYVTWRYLRRPDVQYIVIAIRQWRRLAGWLVLRLRDNRISVGDFLVDPAHASVLGIALRHVAQVYPAVSMDLWCPPRPQWMNELLTSLRLHLTPEPQDLGVMCVPFMDADAPVRMTSLFYTMGDSDLF